jgi:hypothetical protein
MLWMHGRMPLSANQNLDNMSNKMKNWLWIAHFYLCRLSWLTFVEEFGFAHVHYTNSVYFFFRFRFKVSGMISAPGRMRKPSACQSV